MKTSKGSLVMSGLLYAQVLFGVAAVAIVLMRMPASEPVAAVDTMSVASIDGTVASR